MAHAHATLNEFRFHCRDFANVPDDKITAALENAKGGVSQSWFRAADFKLGQCYLAAHNLTLLGQGESKEAEMARSGMLNVASISDGGVSISRAIGDQIALTTYGSLYDNLRRQNVFGGLMAG